MSIRFIRWDLVVDGETKPVLRLLAGDVFMTDDGGVDCFETALAAAEGAWRLAGPPEGDGSWLESAQSALDDEPRGALFPRDIPRVVTSLDMTHERIKWLEDDDALVPSTGEWMLGGVSGRTGGAPPSVEEGMPAALGPLSGLHTAEWSLIGRAVEAAGAPKPGTPKSVALNRPDGIPESESELSGRRTAEWAFASRVGKDEPDKS